MKTGSIFIQKPFWEKILSNHFFTFIAFIIALFFNKIPPDFQISTKYFLSVMKTCFRFPCRSSRIMMKVFIITILFMSFINKYLEILLIPKFYFNKTNPRWSLRMQKYIQWVIQCRGGDILQWDSINMQFRGHRWRDPSNFDVLMEFKYLGGGGGGF